MIIEMMLTSACCAVWIISVFLCLCDENILFYTTCESSVFGLSVHLENNNSSVLCIWIYIYIYI